MKRAFIIASTLTAASLAFVAWCGGYNFDFRNYTVGFFVLLGLVFAVGIGAVAAKLNEP